MHMLLNNWVARCITTVTILRYSEMIYDDTGNDSSNDHNDYDSDDDNVLFYPGEFDHTVFCQLHRDQHHHQPHTTAI